jgi:hypothetical protein
MIAKGLFLTEVGEIIVPQSNADAIVEMVNDAVKDAGIQVKKTTDGRGYGLFATRGFKKGKRVATYGGRQYTGPDAYEQIDAEHAKFPKGGDHEDYVVDVTNNVALDAGIYFAPKYAGRVGAELDGKRARGKEAS